MKLFKSKKTRGRHHAHAVKTGNGHRPKKTRNRLTSGGYAKERRF